MHRRFHLIGLLGLVFLAYLSLAGWLLYGYHFEILRSDVLAYWQDSQLWGASFDVFHVPGYPFLIAFLRWLSLDSLPPLAYLMAINLVAYLAGTALCYAIVDSLLPNGRSWATFAALAYAVWPFIGLVYAVYPIADTLASALVLGGLFLFTRERPFSAAVLLGLASIVHKATWPIGGMIFLAYLLVGMRKPSFKPVGAGLIFLTPVSLVWLFGLSHHGDPLWILSSNLEVEIAPRGSFPILDGILGTLAGGGLSGFLKEAIVVGMAGLAAYLVIGLWTGQQTPYWQVWIGLSAALLALFLVLNRYEIWAAVRFSRLLAVPLALALPPIWERLPFRRWIPAGVLFICCASQVAYAWYMVRVFFG